MIVIFSVNLCVYSNDLTKKSTVAIESQARQLGKIWKGEKIHRAIGLFKKAANNWENLGEFDRATSCLQQSAKLSLLISNHEEAENLLKKALLFDKKTKNVDSRITSLNLLSNVLYESGRLKESRTYSNQAITLSNLTNSIPSKAMSYLTAGILEFTDANVAASQDSFELALSFANETNNENLIAESLLNLGIIYAILYDKESALEAILRSQSIWKNDNNKRGISKSYNGLGFVYVITNEKQKALNNYRKAEKLIPSDVDYMERAKVYSGIATLALNYNKPDMAKRNYEKAYQYFNKANDLFGQLAVLPDLAHFTYLEGDREYSKKLFNISLSLSKKLKSSFHISQTKESLAHIDFEEGRFDEAIKNYEEAYLASEKSGIRLPSIQNSIGKAYEKKGNLKLAKKYFKSALITNKKIQNVVGEAENLYNLAKINFQEGNIKKALEEINKSIELTESVYYDVYNSDLRKHFHSKSHKRYDLKVKLLMSQHKKFPTSSFDIQAFQAFEKSRSRSMIESLNLANENLSIDANKSIIAEKEKISVELNSKKNELANLLFSNEDKKKISKLKLEISILVEKYQQINAELKKKSPIYSQLKSPTTIDVKEFQKKILDDDTVFLEFFFGKKEVYLWLITKNTFEVVILPECNNLGSDIEKLLELMTIRNKLRPNQVTEFQKKLKDADEKFIYKAKKLSQTLFGKIADKIKNKRLIIVRDGKLRYLPISPLPFPSTNANSDNHIPFLMATKEIIFEPSASLLQLIKSLPKVERTLQKDFLVYSNPKYFLDNELINKSVYPENYKTKSEISNQKLPISSNSLLPLVSSEDEANAIKNIYGTANIDIISGANANRTNFLNETLDDYKIIHFATHSYFDEANPNLYGIALSRFSKDDKYQNPYIRLEDIYNAKISADLVVLSACETAIGKDIVGEGLMSLNNAFLQIGAKSVISSYWRVDDKASSELMKEFYKILANEDVTTAQALRKAKIKMYKSAHYNSPYYWSALQFMGISIKKSNYKKIQVT